MQRLELAKVLRMTLSTVTSSYPKVREHSRKSGGWAGELWNANLGAWHGFCTEQMWLLHKTKSVTIPAQMGADTLALPDQHPSRRAIGSWWLLMEGTTAAVRLSIFLGMALHPCAIWAVLTGIRVINNDNDKRIHEGRKDEVLGTGESQREGKGEGKSNIHCIDIWKFQRTDTNIINREKSNFS